MRLLDTMLFRYFHDLGLLDEMLQLPGLGITTAVLTHEISRKWQGKMPDLVQRVEKALAEGSLQLCDPASSEERALYSKYWDIEGFGEGESASMAVAFSRGYTFVSYDSDAVARIGRLGVKVEDWSHLLAELRDRGIITAAEHDRALRELRRMLRRP